MQLSNYMSDIYIAGRTHMQYAIHINLINLNLVVDHIVVQDSNKIFR